MTTILFYVLQLFNARNMLRSGVLEELKSASPDARLVIVSPLAADRRFVEEFTDERTIVEYWPLYEHSPLQKRLTSIAIERFVRTHPTTGTRVRWARQEHVRATRRRQLVALAKEVLGRAPLPASLLLRLSDALVPPESYAPLFRHRPDLVAIGPAWQLAETPWHVGARRSGIPCVAIDVNWDAFESKPGIIRGADYLLVWSERFRQKAVSRFGYRPERVIVTGAPQFDRYFRPHLLASRDEFLARLGFPPDTRLVTLAAIAPFNSPHDPQRLEVLYRAMQAGELGPNCRLLVRLHPIDSMARWEQFRGRPGVRIETAYLEGPGGGCYELGESRLDMKHQAETLLHTDVLVNVNSTISFEAMLLDTPVVMVAFDGTGGHLPYLQSDARFLDYDHMRALVETGGLRVARSPEELVATVRRYLEHPELDRERRLFAAQSLYGPRDGRAAARVAEHLLRLASQHRREAGFGARPGARSTPGA